MRISTAKRRRRPSKGFDRTYALFDGQATAINFDGRSRIDLKMWCEKRFGPEGSTFLEKDWSFTDDLRLPKGAELTEFKLTWL